MVSEEWKIFQDLRKTVIDKNPICSKCGCKEHLEVDHIVPDYCGGLTEISNLQTLCHMCHSKKTIDDRKKYPWKNRGRGRANTSFVMFFRNGQMMITLPRGIAEAMRLNKGDTIEWIFDRGDLIIR